MTRITEPTPLVRGQYKVFADSKDPDVIKCPRYLGNAGKSWRWYAFNELGLPIRLMVYDPDDIYLHRITSGENPTYFDGPSDERNEQIHGRWVEVLNQPDHTLTSKAELTRWVKAALQAPWCRTSHGHGGRGWYSAAPEWMEMEFKAASFKYEGNSIEIHRVRTLRGPTNTQYNYATKDDEAYLVINGSRLPFGDDSLQRKAAPLIRIIENPEDTRNAEIERMKQQREFKYSVLQQVCELRVQAWEKLNDSGLSVAVRERMGREDQRLMADIEARAAEMGWATDWPGLYPCFSNYAGHDPGFTFLERREHESVG